MEPFVVRQKKNNNNGEENIESNENPTNNENPISDNANVNENDDVDVNKNDEVDVNENDDANLNENDDLDVNENDDVDVNEDHVENVNESLPKVNYNIFDVRVWDGLRSHMKDELVSKWPIRETNLDYPKDKIGTNDWKHLSTALKKHENSSEHMINFRTWSELRISYHDDFDWNMKCGVRGCELKCLCPEVETPRYLLGLRVSTRAAIAVLKQERPQRPEMFRPDILSPQLKWNRQLSMIAIDSSVAILSRWKFMS
ncbi:hypothetical protein Tco_0436191 [Tanacetum coccineum]